MRHLTAIAHHRNGLMGVGFHVVLFRDGKEPMLGIKFDNVESDKSVYTAVLSVDKLTDGDIAFGSNSYRGDEFDEDLTAWSSMYEAERSAAATGENEREARAQETMKAFAEEEAIKASVKAGVEWLVQGKMEADRRTQ
jgi:hypothetical protein